MSKTVYVAGHGNYMDEYGSFAVPTNTTVKFYVDHGVGFDDSFEFVVLKKHALSDLNLSAETRADIRREAGKGPEIDIAVDHQAAGPKGRPRLRRAAGPTCPAGARRIARYAATVVTAEEIA